MVSFALCFVLIFFYNRGKINVLVVTDRGRYFTYSQYKGALSVQLESCDSPLLSLILHVGLY